MPEPSFTWHRFIIACTIAVSRLYCLIRILIGKNYLHNIKCNDKEGYIYNTQIYTHSMFKILNFFNRAPFNITVFTNIQKAHIKRSMYKRVTVFSRLHFTTCFTISSWQKCHYYIGTFLIKTIFHSQKFM